MYAFATFTNIEQHQQIVSNVLRMSLCLYLRELSFKLALL